MSKNKAYLGKIRVLRAKQICARIIWYSRNFKLSILYNFLHLVYPRWKISFRKRANVIKNQQTSAAL